MKATEHYFHYPTISKRQVISMLGHTLVILDRDGTAVEVASDLPVTLSSSSAAYLQNRAWSDALSSITGSRIKT